MDWIQSESFRLGCPAFADELEGREAFEGLQPSPEIIGADELAKVCLELSMAVVMVTLDGGFLDSPVHSLDLAIGPWMLDFGQPVLDAIFLASHVEHMGHVGRRRAMGVAWREGELDAVVGEHGVDFIGNRLDQARQEGRC